MEFKLTIELGNAAMQTALDVSESVASSLDVGYDAELTDGMEGRMRDLNGNTVGRWEVVADDELTTPAARSSRGSPPS